MTKGFVTTAFVLALAGLAIGAQPTPTELQSDLHFSLDVIPTVSVTVLVDNLAGTPSLLGEWGASFLVDTGDDQILFDTGRGRALLLNAEALQVDLGETDALVISHGHRDHTGALAEALEASGHAALYVHPAAFQRRYWKGSSGVVEYGLFLDAPRIKEEATRIIERSEPTVIGKGVMVTGQIPRVTDFEDTGVTDLAFLDQGTQTPDPILDDQALFFRAPEGVVILLGCGHAGVVNTMRYVSELLGEKKIYAVIGGTHLLNASPHRMEQTITALREYDVQKIMLTHCTGLEAYVEFSKVFADRCSWPGSGTLTRFGSQ